jgi:hypothetical protein
MGPRGKESGHTGLPGSGDFGFIGAALLAKLTPKGKKSVIARSVWKTIAKAGGGSSSLGRK